MQEPDRLPPEVAERNRELTRAVVGVWTATAEYINGGMISDDMLTLVEDLIRPWHPLDVLVKQSVLAVRLAQLLADERGVDVMDIVRALALEVEPPA